MSTDFIALFDASENINANWLLAKLSNDTEFGAKVIEYFREKWQPQSWIIDASQDTNQPDILGPGGFVIRPRPPIIEMYHMMPFGTFTGEAIWREALRNACLTIADLVGSTKAIYTHELMPYEGNGLAEIDSNLRKEIGPPATSFEELHNAEYWGPRAWFVDTFEDLRVPG